MRKKSIKTTSDDSPPLKKSDIAKGKLVLRQRLASGQVKPNKQRVNIFLDTVIVEHFKALAGERGYQTLINQSLLAALQQEELEKTIRKAIRSEMRALRKAA